MRVTQKYISYLKRAEGLRLEAYKPQGEGYVYGDKLTIGYGHLGARPGEKITIAQADDFLMKDIQKVEAEMLFLPGLKKLSLSRWTAIVDFIFNCGISAFKRSTLYKLIKENPENPAIPNEFKKWIWSGGKVLRGLKSRRSYEANLWIKNTDTDV